MNLFDYIDTELQHLGPIEVQIVAEIVYRLRVGQAQYGQFPAVETRNLKREVFEEIADALVYSARALLK